MSSLSPLAIRRAGPEDIGLIRDLTGRIWPVTYGRILPPGQVEYMIARLYDPALLREQMTGGQEFFLVYRDEVPVAFAAVGPDGPAAYKLHKLYVLPDQQGKGTGRYLVDNIIAELRSREAKWLRLNVNRSNPALDFYRRLDFVVIRSEDIDIGGGYFMNDFVMERPV